VLIVAGSKDDAIGPDDARDLLAAALAGGSRAELKVCEGAGHAEAIQTCSADYGAWMLDFLDRSLPNAP